MFKFSNGQTFDETLTKSSSGLVTAQTDVFGTNSVTNTYAYDKAGRLTEAVIDKNKYTYGYGAPNMATCNQASANANAHKNSNRTAYTVTNILTSQLTSQANYCYDQADRLLASSDTQIGTPTYDDHGNTVSFAGGGTPITLNYDAADSNIAITQGNNKIEYVKSASGNVLRKKEYVNNALTKSYRHIAGGSVLQTCANNDDNNCVTTDKYVSLPGGVMLTLTPSHPQPAQQEVYSVKNFHGDTAMTAGPDGNATSSVFMYEPFGQQSQSVTFGTGSNPQNGSAGSMGWAADSSRVAEQPFTLPIIQMGARVYLPTFGRFAQVDPVEGGTANAYVYSSDPINADDYSGKFVFAIPLIWGLALAAVGAVAVHQVMNTPVVKNAGIALIDSIGSSITGNSRAQSNSKGQNKNSNQGYRPTTRLGGVAIRPETLKSQVKIRAAAFVAGQLAAGIKPISGTRPLPILAPSGQPSKSGGSLNFGPQKHMSKYSYLYFDVPTGEKIEIHYTIDEAKREYEDLKAK